MSCGDSSSSIWKRKIQIKFPEWEIDWKGRDHIWLDTREIFDNGLNKNVNMWLTSFILRDKGRVIFWTWNAGFKMIGFLIGGEKNQKIVS